MCREREKRAGEKGEERTQNGQRDVDEEIDTTAALEEDTQRREDDGEDDLANVAANFQTLACLSGVPGEAPLRGRPGLRGSPGEALGWLGRKAYEAVKAMLAVVGRVCSICDCLWSD